VTGGRDLAVHTSGVQSIPGHVGRYAIPFCELVCTPTLGSGARKQRSWQEKCAAKRSRFLLLGGFTRPLEQAADVTNFREIVLHQHVGQLVRDVAVAPAPAA
jgi:hypothetical protein